MERIEKRNRIIIAMRSHGMGLQQIGALFNISRQRIYQIVGKGAPIFWVRQRLDADIARRIKQDRKITEAVTRFWSRVDKSAGPNACWLWIAAIDEGGYGRFQDNDLSNDLYTHRTSFYLANGYFPIRPMNVLHRCNNPRCVNPKHLYEGTYEQNMADAVAARGGIHWHTKA